VFDLSIEFVPLEVTQEIVRRTGMEYEAVEAVIQSLQDIHRERSGYEALERSVADLGLTREQIDHIKKTR
jgi:hypothetical protein